MQFTLWKDNKSPIGGHAEITWEDFLAFVRSPQIATDKDKLEGWSPAKFKDNTRSDANVESVSEIGLDDDSSGLTTEQVASIWGDVAGVVHTSFSHTPEHPKHRIVLRCSRAMTVTEHARVMQWAHDRAAAHGQVLDLATRNPSRLWYVPAHREGALYEMRELMGAPLDVDAIVAETPLEIAPTAPAPAPHADAPAANRRTAVASMLAAAWPPHTKRHEAKLALAGALRSEGWSKDEAREFLQRLYDIVGSEGDTDTEALNSTYRKPEGSALTGWTRLKSFVDPVVVDAARSALGRDAEGLEMMERKLAEVAAARSSDPEDKPEPLPEFPVGALPGVLARFATVLALFNQVRVDVPAMLSLGACAAAVAGRRDIELPWIEGLNLFIVVALLTGERKSPVHAACFAPLVEAERMQQEAQRPLVDFAKSKRAALERKLVKLQTEYANTKREDAALERANNSAKPGGAGIMAEIEALSKELSTMPKTALPRLLADDVTEERLAGLMAEQGGRMCVTSDEDTILQNLAGRYANGRSSFSVFLKGYTGTPITYDRKTDSEYFAIRRPRLSVCITVQPSVIEGLTKDRSMRNKGLLGRFLYSIPASVVGERSTEDATVPKDIIGDYRKIVQGLVSIPAPADNEPIPCIKLSAEALELHRQFREWLEPRLHPKTGDLAEIVDWANKLAGNVGRVAGVLHCIEYGPRSHTVELSRETMVNAIRIGEYLLAHAQAAFGCMGTTDVEADAQLLETWARAKGAFTRTKLFQCGPRPLRDKRRLLPALEYLIERGTLKEAGKGWQVVEGG